MPCHALISLSSCALLLPSYFTTPCIQAEPLPLDALLAGLDTLGQEQPFMCVVAFAVMFLSAGTLA